MADSTSKIFGIGLSKTGTTSLANALQILGYKTRDNIGVTNYVAGDLSSIDLDLVGAFDALTDTPIPSFYRELDKRFPGSKFILTVRARDEWLTSCKKQFTQRFADVQTEAHKHLFVDLYGTDVFDEGRFASGYERFLSGVLEYFKDRAQDLLIIDVASGEGWEKLCPFLGHAIPDLPFPKANVTQITWIKIEEVLAVAKQGGEALMLRRPGGTSSHGRSSDKPKLPLRKIFEGFVSRASREDSADAAVQAVYKVVFKGLSKLSPGIPLLSSPGHLPAYAERRPWHHLWLVDPLDGEAAFLNGANEFSVNIALIEDGKPIYGVVYAPAIETAYYGRVGKSSYRLIRNNPPINLRRPDAWPLFAKNDSAPDDGSTPQTKREGTSHALMICKAIHGDAAGDGTFRNSMEWHSAAADAIVRSAGMRLCELGSEGELSYNKPELSNPPFTIC
jgi:3'-phosphoadenosine 5'-phosphosulfate (PAPS) 3'-phosphatase